MKIAFVLPDGGVRIVTPTPKREGEPDADYRVRVFAQSIPADAKQITELEELPADTTFRDAWVLKKGRIEVDLARARALRSAAIERARQRSMRDLLLRQALGEDVAAQIAALAAIDSRALTKAAGSVDELRAVNPGGVLG